MTIRELVTWLGFKIDDGTLNEYNRKVEAAKKKSSELSNAVSGVGKAVKLIGGAVAAAGIAALGKSILDTTGEVEQYRVTLGTMIGDQQKANQIIHDLDYSPVSDFYGTAAAIGGLQGMVTFGMQAEDAADTLTRLGDIAQGNGDAFKSLSLNMGQVFAKGKADATDLKQFVGQGFDVVGEVSKMTGKSRAEIEKAGVTYEQCAQALVHITSEGGKYNGMLAKQSKTLPGLIKQFQSLSAAIKEAIGTAVLDKVKDLMQYFLDLIKGIEGVRDGLHDGIVNIGTKAFEAILDGIADVIIALEVLKIRMEKFGGAFTPIKALFKDVFGFLSDVLQSAIPYFMAVAQAILLAFKPIQAFVSPILEALKTLFKNVFQFGAEQIKGLLPYIDKLTSAFVKIGDLIAGLIDKLSPILKNLHDTIMAAFEPIEVFVMPILEALWGVAQMVFGAFSRLLDDAADATSGLAGIIESLTPIMSVLGNIVGAIITVFANGLSVILPILKPLLPIILGIVAAIKIWTVVQTILNAVMYANPIGLIILAIVALIGVIVLLVKNWDKVKAALLKGAKVVGDFFKKIWNAIKNAAIAAFNKLKDAVIKVIDGIKAVWAKVTDFFAALWDGIVSVAKSVWNTLVEFFTGLVEGIKSVWNTIIEFFSNLWDGIVSVATNVWNGIVDVFFAVIEKIKAVWNGITDFFSGLWDSLKESVVGVADAIKDTFLGLFDVVKKQFFGFIDTIKEGWEKVKRFFGGLWDGAVNFFTGGESDAGSPTKVNDMILTPDGTYSTHPDDTIFAMKNPASLVDRLADFLAMSAPQPAYALAGNSVSQAIRQSVSNDYSRHSSSSVYNTPIHVTVNASSMSAEQAKRAVESGVRGALRDAIAGSRGVIPSPEARRA